MKKSILLGATAALAAVLTVTSFAHGDSGKRYPQSQYRHDVMEIVKYSGLSIIHGIKKEVPTPAEHYAVHADILHKAAVMSLDSFQEDTRNIEGKTDSLPAVWEDWDDFNGRMKKFIDDTAALKAAADTGDFAALVAASKPVFSSCKECHDKYRKED